MICHDLYALYITIIGYISQYVRYNLSRFMHFVRMAGNNAPYRAMLFRTAFIMDSPGISTTDVHDLAHLTNALECLRKICYN